MICFPLDNTLYEARDMGTYLATRGRGVFSADGNLCVTAGENGLSVVVSPGLAWLKWAEFWGVAALQEQPLTLTLDPADGALSRVDAVVCRLDKVNNCAELTVKKGAFSSAPVVLPPVRDTNLDELYLATVLVQAGAVSITAGAITDQRLNEDYCGLMRDGVTGIPTARLQEQAQALLTQLDTLLKGVKGGSELMLKTDYDPDGDGVVDQAADSAKLGGQAAAAYASAQGLQAAQTELAAHAARKDNPHGVTKAQLGLGNVNNTADSAKSVNYATTAGSARANNIGMALSGTTLIINYS